MAKYTVTFLIEDDSKIVGMVDRLSKSGRLSQFVSLSVSKVLSEREDSSGKSEEGIKKQDQSDLLELITNQNALIERLSLGVLDVAKEAVKNKPVQIQSAPVQMPVQESEPIEEIEEIEQIPTEFDLSDLDEETDFFGDDDLASMTTTSSPKKKNLDADSIKDINRKMG